MITYHEVTDEIDGERVTILGGIERLPDAEELKLNLERYYGARRVKILEESD